MRRFIFICMLAAVSGAWTVCLAVCMASRMPQTGETEWFTGQLQEVANPCEEDEPCPACLTVALVTTDSQTYYLTDMDEEWQQWVENTYLEDWYMYSIALSGRRFTQGNYEYIQIEDIRARCIGGITTCLDKLPITISGTLVPYQAGEYFGTDCETVVLEYADGAFYLLTWGWGSVSQDIQIMLDTLQHPLPVTLSGQLDCGCVIVRNITLDPIPSLCDAWNVLVEDGVGCDDCAIYTQEYRLKGDTTIAEMNYKKMLLADNYQGALREGNNRDIYFIPAASSHEYLLYAFNAQVGDTLNNVWIGGPLTWYPEGWIVTVTEIHDTNPRIFTLETIIQYDYDYSKVWQVGWIEGVGMSDGPFGTPLRCIGCADGRGIGLLCAYKNGERVYTTPMAESFGCWYSNEQTADTIPLYRYTGDGPDGSTVDPVDPNQVVVILQGDELTIREFMGEDITYNLEIRTQNNAPAQAQAPTRDYGSQTFREYVAIQLTEDGRYTLQLTNPEWGYGMVATFNYGRNALPSTSAEQPAAQKILQNGQLLIRQGERMFTPTGMQVGIITPTD